MTPTEEKTANVSVGDKSVADVDTKSAIEPQMADKSNGDAYDYYKIRKHDTFWTLGKTWGYDYKVLMKLNGYDSESAKTLKVGTVIKAPKGMIPTALLYDQDSEKITTPTITSISFRYPVDYIGITQEFSKNHLGTDFGWNSEYGGRNAPIYAITPGNVVISKYSKTVGHYIVVEYNVNDRTWISRYKHLSSRDVSTGDKLSIGDKIGNMGNTGVTSKGTHLHLDLINLPAKHVYSEAERAIYSVNPLLYLHAYKNQIIGELTDKRYMILRKD